MVSSSSHAGHRAEMLLTMIVGIEDITARIGVGVEWVCALDIDFPCHWELQVGVAEQWGDFKLGEAIQRLLHLGTSDLKGE